MSPSQIVCVLAVLLPLPALAGSMTLANTTNIVAYSGATPYAYYTGSNPYIGQAAIGPEFNTVSLTVQAVQLAGGDVAVDFSYLTQFSGSEMVSGVPVGAADIFLAPSGGAFGYGLSLGLQGGNGGVAAGFYAVQSEATSQQIWTARQGFVYGGAVAISPQFEPGQAGYEAFAAPTVITSGKLLDAAVVSVSQMNAAWFTIDASVVMPASQAAMFDQGFEVFWGTGDCGNGAFLADVPGLPIMEPASFLMLISAFALVSYLRQRPKTRRSNGNVAHRQGHQPWPSSQTGSVSRA